MNFKAVSGVQTPVPKFGKNLCYSLVTYVKRNNGTLCTDNIELEMPRNTYRLQVRVLSSCNEMNSMSTVYTRVHGNMHYHELFSEECT